MDAIIGIVIFIVVGILSIAQKMKEQRELKQRMDLEEAQEDRAASSGDYEESMRSAKPRGARTRRAQVELPQDMDDVIRQLMGHPASTPPPLKRAEAEEEEPDWEPVPPPMRREIPQRVQQQRRQPARSQPERQRRQPTRQQPPHRDRVPPAARREGRRRTVAEPVSPPQARPRQHKERPTLDEVERRQRERQQEMERRMRSREQPERQRTSGRAGRHVRRRATGRRRLLNDLGEVRRAIIVSEVIGAPRALKDLEPRV